MQRIEGKKIQVYLTEEELSRLEKIQKRHDMTRSDALRRMLDIGMDVYDEFSHVGIPQLAVLAVKVKKYLRERRQPKIEW